MTASLRIRFAALSIALTMTAVVHGTLLAGFDKLAQDGVVAQQSAGVSVAAAPNGNFVVRAH